jgi:hypothetical protein
MEDIGLNGSGSKFNSRFEAGAPIQAKQLNDLSYGVQAGLPIPYLGHGITVSFTPGGANITTLPDAIRGSGARILQQFEIVMQTVTTGEGEEKEVHPLLTVVQGNLICTDLQGANQAWVSEYTNACIPPSGVTAIKGDSNNKIFINNIQGTTKTGPGGWQLPDASGSGNRYGIYLVQINNQKTDFDPIIFIAEADQTWPYELPIKIPSTVIDKEDLGVNEFPQYDMITIGRVIDDETLKVWVVEKQESIGTLTMPEPVKTGPQLPTWTSPEEKIPAPFECSQGRVTEDGQDFWCLKIGKGSMTYNVTNMPTINFGAVSNQYQSQYEICQVRYPNTDKTDDTWGEDSPWMVNGGYDLPTAFGAHYLFAVKWDLNTDNYPAGGGEAPESVKNWPMLCLMDTESAQACFKETGPTAYSNYMNVQKMTGYAEIKNGNDFGFCHTSYFNPMKIGFAAKMIAKIDVVSEDPGECVISVLQTADGSRNRIYEIQFTAPVKSGGIKFAFSRNGVYTEQSDFFYPAEEFARHLYNALQKIEVLKKNVLVSQIDDRTFYVTLINHLQMRDYWGVDLNSGEYQLTVSTDELAWFNKSYKIEQYHTGSLNMEIPLLYNGAQLMNEDGWTEQDDWYIYNRDNNWVDIVNIDNLFSFGMYSASSAKPAELVSKTTPLAYTPGNFDNFYLQEGGCIADACDHPFQVRRTGSAESNVWSICEGTVNNVLPDPAFSTFTLTDGFVWLKIKFDGTDFPSLGTYGVAAGWGETVPNGDDDYGYVVLAQITDDVATQYVTGSLWGDRIKMGDITATYYFARV